MASVDEVARKSLIEEIHAVFTGVRREGGISWRQAEIDDFYGDEEIVEYVDTDTCWEDLIGNSAWRPDAGVGGWSFLDAIGFRYYLPAAMIRAIDSDDDFAYHLKVTDEKDRFYEFTLSQFALFDDRQRRCIAQFLRYMNAKDHQFVKEQQVDPAISESWEQWVANYSSDWGEAYDSYWAQFDVPGCS